MYIYTDLTKKLLIMDPYQLRLAQNAGTVPDEISSKTFDTWLEEYEHHVNTVNKPLGFTLFKSKFIKLSQLFDSDPNGVNSALDRPIMNLCNELGY